MSLRTVCMGCQVYWNITIVNSTGYSPLYMASHVQWWNDRNFFEVYWYYGFKSCTHQWYTHIAICSYVHIHIYTFACTSCPVCTLVQSDIGYHMKTLKGEGTKNSTSRLPRHQCTHLVYWQWSWHSHTETRGQTVTSATTYASGIVTRPTGAVFALSVQTYHILPAYSHGLHIH